MYDFFPNQTLRPFYPSMHGVPGSSQRKGIRKSTATAFYVDPGGNDNNKGWDAEHPLATIQQAITNAESGDWVVIMPGVYGENVQVNKSLTILGPNRFGAVVIQPNDGPGMTVTANNVTIANLNIWGDDEALILDEIIGFMAIDTRIAAADTLVEITTSGNVVFERCAFWSGDNGISFVENDDDDPCVNIVVKDCAFLLIDDAGILDSGTETVLRLLVSDCLFEGSPTKFIDVDDAASTGIITRCSFANATNATAQFDIAAGVMWVANFTEAGVTTARPA